MATWVVSLWFLKWILSLEIQMAAEAEKQKRLVRKPQDSLKWLSHTS